MGARISSETLIEENAYLRRFVGLQPISDNDPFWNYFLSFNFLIDSNDRLLFFFITKCCLRLIIHDVKMLEI